MAPTTLSFDVDQSDEDDYKEFIRRIRDELRHSDSHGIPVLRPQEPEMTGDERWLDLELIAGGDRITLRVERSNLYVRGYQRTSRGDNFFWEFADTTLIVPREALRFNGGYVGGNSMGGRAGVLRGDLLLGRAQLVNAVRYLARTDPRAAEDQGVAHNLFVGVQMVAESVRFPPIEEHIRAHYWDHEGVRLDARMVHMENSWCLLSTAMRQVDLFPTPNTPLPSIPTINPTQVYTFGQALAALGILIIVRRVDGGAGSRHKRETVDYQGTYLFDRRLVDNYGRCLMNLDYVQVNSLYGEEPGNLFGTVTVDDGWFKYTFYHRSSADNEDVSPAGFATLIDSSQSHAVSGADSFVVSVDLFDHNWFSPNNKIAQGQIVWDRSVEGVNFENYDRHLRRVVKGDHGEVTVGYSVLSMALSVTIQVLLTDGNEEDPAQVYGTLAAYQVLGGYDRSAQMTLFKKTEGEYEEVGKGQPIPLAREVMAASMSTMLTIVANLWDHDTISSDDKIAQGSVDFTVQHGTQKEFIHGENGEVQVIITCE